MNGSVMNQKTVLDQQQTALDIDPEFLRSRYEEERLKRLREGDRAYVSIEGKLAHYADDPYVEPGFTREPLRDEVDVVIIGGGFSGLLAAGRLRKQGVDSIRIIERGGDFGGTWYWNRYPGAACDIESYCYMPLLEEVGHVPSEKYARQMEIYAHCRALGRHFDLYKNACFQTAVTEARWDDDAQRWIIKTNRDDEMRARFICTATGTFSRPKLPGIPGLETFSGHSFHTSRWDYDYTGGEESRGELQNLKDKRVALIGTGATAIQCLPYLGEWSKQLYVFQRTPSGVSIRGNRATDPEWARSLAPGWQKERMENFHLITTGVPVEEDLVNDGWTAASSELSKPFIAPPAGADPMVLRQLADYKVMEGIRRRVDEIVEDPETAQALKPYYNYMCKRPCFHDSYLQTFNRPNVSLIDTKGKGIDAIEGDRIIVGDEAYQVDLIVYGTGFEQNAPADRAGNFDIIGRHGETLSDSWANKGLRTLHGIFTPGFPNMLILGGLNQTGGSPNFPYTLDGQSTHISAVIKESLVRGVSSMDVTENAAERWVQTIREKSMPLREFLATCTPGYMNKEGKVDGSFFLDVYGGPMAEYMDLIEQWRTSGGADQDMEMKFSGA